MQKVFVSTHANSIGSDGAFKPSNTNDRNQCSANNTDVIDEVIHNIHQLNGINA